MNLITQYTVLHREHLHLLKANARKKRKLTSLRQALRWERTIGKTGNKLLLTALGAATAFIFIQTIFLLILLFP